MKKCNLCNVEKELSEFYKHPKAKDGLQGRCKSCVKEVAKSWQKEYIKTAKGREWIRSKGSLKKRPYLVHRKDKCRRCGFIPENDCQLTVDHIDRNRNNNSVGNLQTLCHNCHNLKSWVEIVEPDKLLEKNLIPNRNEVVVPDVGLN